MFRPCESKVSVPAGAVLTAKLPPLLSAKIEFSYVTVKSVPAGTLRTSTPRVLPAIVTLVMLRVFESPEPGNTLIALVLLSLKVELTIVVLP